MSSRRWIRRQFTASLLALLGGACSEESPVEPGSLAEIAPASLVVSDASRPSSVSAAVQTNNPRASIASASDAEVAYVSLPTGTFPNATSVTIRNLSTDSAPMPPVPFVDGGFDPVSVVASADEELELRINGAVGEIALYRAVVPKRRPPRVVRTNPPKGATDVALNTRIITVFTEPVAPATVTGETVQLLHGSTAIAGTVHAVSGSLFAVEFVPENELQSGTPYTLVLKRGIRDTQGDSLEADVATDFTTVAAISFVPSASIVAGLRHTCRVRADGNVICWGQNWHGQLGAGDNLFGIGTCPSAVLGSVFLCSTLPVAVVGGRTFASIASGYVHTCGVTPAGEAFCWGDNGGLPGGEDWPPRCDPATENCGCDPSSGKCSGEPVQVSGSIRFESVVAGFWHTCGIRVGGGAYCWGDELLVGGLGTGDAGITSTPAAVAGDIVFTSLTSGAHHICGLDRGGAAFCWGLNLAGQLGFSGGDNCGGPVTSYRGFVWLCAKVPTRITGALRFVALTAGWEHTCGLTPAGRAYCWGDYLFAGGYGAPPRSVSDDLVFASLSSGSGSSHTCGVTSENVAYCWGRNDLGQLGNGSQTSTLTPVRVAGGLAFSAVAAGDEHSCGMTVVGELFCWGSNLTGQLGVGDASVGSLVPIRVAAQ